MVKGAPAVDDFAAGVAAPTPRRRPIDQGLSAVTLSIVVPMFNEGAGIERLFAELGAVLSKIGCRYEIICVDDGSHDDTVARLMAQRERDKHIKIVKLSRNFGKELALTAGLGYCRGDAVIPIDADLQDPPEMIPAMIDKWREGYDVVYARRASREADGPFKRLSAALFYRSFNSLTDCAIPENVGDFRLMDRRVVAALQAFPERNRFMKGLFSWVGFRQVAISFDRPARATGRSAWSLWRLWNFALDGITSFSSAPLRVSTYVGVVLCLFAFVYAAFLIVWALSAGIHTPGYASLMVTVLFFGGMQFITIGILGEYIGRIYQEVKRRPLYIVDEAIGVDEDGHS